MITEFRAVATHHLQGSPWPVYQYLPDDVSALPCIAVPRVTLEPHPDVKGVVRGAIDLLVIGSRIANDESAAELDGMADLVVERFGSVAKSVRMESTVVVAIVVALAQPSTVTVGGLEYPCYVITLESTVAPPC